METRRKTDLELLIEAGCYAGAYRALARKCPESAGGLLKLARKHSARVAALAEGLAGVASQATPHQ